MADAILSPVLKQRWFNNNGLPLANGKLYTYVAGSAGNVNKPTYGSKDMLDVNANPVPVDTDGYADVWLSPDGAYLFVLTDALGVVQWTIDNVKGAAETDVAVTALEALLAANTGATLIGTLGGISVQTTLNNFDTQKADKSVVAALDVRVTDAEGDIALLQGNAQSGLLGYSLYSELVAAHSPYDNVAVYNQGDTMVSQNAFWEYVNVTPAAGNAPPVLPISSNAYWALKNLLPGGQLAEVPLTDTGTHTDPVVGGTVNNSGIFRWNVAPVGWRRLYDVAAASAIPYATAAALSAGEAAESANDAFNSAVIAASVVVGDLNPVELLIFSALQNRRIAKVNSTTITSNTTITADPNLTIPLAPFTRTIIKGNIKYSTGAVGDFKYRLLGPAGCTVHIERFAIEPPGGITSAATDTAFSGADIVLNAGGAGSGTVNFEGSVETSATSGNFQFAWAQNTSDANPTTVKGGSTLEFALVPTVFNFAFADNAIAKLGAFTGPVAAGGHNVMSAVAPTGIAHSYIETMVTGTTVEAQLFTGNYTVEVDGGAPVVVAGPGGSTWGFVPLFTGLADTTHRVRVSQAVPYDSDITLRVTGTTPLVSRPTDVPTYYPLGQAPFDGYIAQDGVMALDASTGAILQRIWYVGTGCGLRFGATTTSVRVWMFNGFSVGPIVLYQDGVPIATVTPPSTPNRYELITLATGLTGTHEYEITPISMTTQTFIYAILVDTLSAVAHPARAADAYYGDSIVQGGSSGSVDGRTTDAYILANATGRSAMRVGAGATGVSVNNGNQLDKYGRDNTLKITGLTSVPTRVFVCYGANDMFYGVPLATFEADYITMLTALRAGLPAAKIYCRGILPQYRNTNADRLLYNARILAAQTAMADANIVYTDTDGWISVTPGVDLQDNVHPKSTGYAKIAAAQQLVL